MLKIEPVDLLTGGLWDIEEREESRLTPTFLAWVPERWECPCTEIGTAVGRAGFWWEDSVLHIFEMSSQHSNGDASRQVDS